VLDHLDLVLVGVDTDDVGGAPVRLDVVAGLVVLRGGKDMVRFCTVCTINADPAKEGIAAHPAQAVADGKPPTHAAWLFFGFFRVTGSGSST